MELGSFLDELDARGVSAMRNFVETDILSDIIKEWEEFEKSGKQSVSVAEGPLVSLWRHQVGGKKKQRPISEFDSIQKLAFSDEISELVRKVSKGEDVRLLETIIFDKPPGVGGQLCWHQDVPFFPIMPTEEGNNWFLTIWIPLDPVTRENGALEYIIGSHENGIKASVDLHSGAIYENDMRDVIDTDGIHSGKYQLFQGDAKVGDLLAHNGLTWHSSCPNITKNLNRRAVAFKYILGDVIYSERGDGNTSTFIGGATFKEGDKIQGDVFPLI